MSGLQNKHFPTLFLNQNAKYQLSIINYQIKFVSLHPLSTKKQHRRMLGKAGKGDRWQGPLSNQQDNATCTCLSSHEA